MKHIIKTVILDDKAVDTISGEIQSRLKAIGVQEANIVRARLAVEAVLLNIADHYECKKEITVMLGNKFGSRYFIVRYEGDAYNPMEDAASKGWSDTLLSNVALKPIWSHKGDFNEIFFRVPRPQIKDEMLLVGAVVAAFIVGAIGYLLPSDISSALSRYILVPAADLFMNMLNTFAGLVVFMSLLAGIMGIGKLSDFNKIGNYMIRRFIVFNLIGCGIAVLVLLPFHHLNFGPSSAESNWEDLLKMVLNIIPSDPVKPFADGNILQVVFMAVLIGITMLILSREIPVVHSFMYQSNQVIIHVVALVCRLLPIYIFASITALIWKNGFGVFYSIWKPILFCIILVHVLLIAKLIYTSLKLKVSVTVLLRKILPSYIIGLTTASSMAAFGASMDINERKLGIPAELNKIGLPLGNILSCSTVCAGFVAIIYYLAEQTGCDVGPEWFVAVWIGITIITCALPPVSGGALIGIGIMLDEYGIPISYVALASTILMFCDFFMTSTRIGILHLELALQAEHWGTLDKDKLRSD